MIRKWKELLNRFNWLILTISATYYLLRSNSYSVIPRAMIVRSFSIFQCQSSFQFSYMRTSLMKMRYSSKKRPLYYNSNFEDDDDETVSSKQNQRFWTRSYSFNLSTLLASQSTSFATASTITPSELLTVVVDTLQMKQQQVPESERSDDATSPSKVVIPKCDSGLVIVTMQATTATAVTSDAFTCNLIVPIHNAVLQTQHAFLSRNGEYLDSKASSPAALSSADVRIPTNPLTSSSPPDISFMVCGFFPRAQHVIQGPNEYERPVDMERLAALDAALLNSTSTSAPEVSQIVYGWYCIPTVLHIYMCVCVVCACMYVY